MWRSIQEGSALGWGPEFAPCAEFRWYMLRQLWRRGLRHRGRLSEGLEVAVHLFTVDLWRRGAPPVDWPGWRAMLDRAVYQAMLELRPCASAGADFDAVSPRGTDPQEESAEERGRELVDRVERLPVPQRLVFKLKLAEVFFPELSTEAVPWSWDEADFLLKQHPDRSLEALNAELHTRLVCHPHRHRGKVPSSVIAWLLGRASSDAVDTSFREIKEQLRSAAPSGAAPVSWAVVCRTIHRERP